MADTEGTWTRTQYGVGTKEHGIEERYDSPERALRMFNALKEVDGSTPLLTVVVTTSQEWSEADLVAAVALAAN